MFDLLITSSPLGAARRVVRNCAVALAGHGVVCGVAVWATVHPNRVPAASPSLLITWPQPDRSESRGLPRSVDGLDVAVPPLPPIGLPLVEPVAPPLRGAGGGREGASSSGTAPMTPGFENAPWAAAVVEEPPALLAGRRPRYPDLLQAAGITGRVVVQVVIDTLGRAEPGSAVVVQSSNAGFDMSARQYVRDALFRPARVHGRAVRVLVRVPIDFTLTAGQ